MWCFLFCSSCGVYAVHSNSIHYYEVVVVEVVVVEVEVVVVVVVVEVVVEAVVVEKELRSPTDLPKSYLLTIDSTYVSQ